MAEKIIELCTQYNENVYTDINMNHLIAYTIEYLNNNNIALSFENICVASYLMFPKKFSLIGYDEYPDSNRVNLVLLHLRPKYDNLAEGNIKSGFTLTEKGKIYVEKAKQKSQNLYQVVDALFKELHVN